MATEESSTPNPGRKLFFGLFVFPLLIAVGMAVLLCTVVFLTNEAESPESLITAIKTGSPSKRWQKAFELSNELNRGEPSLRNMGVMREIIHILNDPAHYDPKTRGYMALALGHFRNSDAVEALRRNLSDPHEDVRIYSLWSLGVLQAGDAVPDALPHLSAESPDIRKTAAYVLGAMGDRRAILPLKEALEDPIPDVRWNAALSLARLGDDSGADVLMEMLDRERLSKVHRLTENQMEGVMTSAAKALALIRNPQSFKILETISRTDKNLKVRQAALEAKKIAHD